MKNMTKMVAAIGVAVSFASAAVAQSGPVDSKGQAGSVQQFDNRVTQGTNSQDAADSRARMRSLGSGGAANDGVTTGSVTSPESGGAGGTATDAPQSKTR